MRVSIIAAMDRNRLIGRDNGLPWRLPADLSHFKAVTMGKPVIMGRKTYESIGRPLPGRLNIVLTRSETLRIEGVETVGSLQDALDLAAKQTGVEEVMVIGGSNLYEQALPLADRMYLTEVQSEYEGDAWFPRYDHSEWQLRECSEHPADDRNEVAYSFAVYDRVR